MNNEKMLSKLRILSRISAVSVIAYILLTAYNFFPEAKRDFLSGMNAYESGEEVMKDPSLWKVLTAFPCGIALVTSLVIIIVAGLQLLFGMSKGNSPFNEKVSRAIKNLGVSCIVFELLRTYLFFIMEETVNIGMLWLAGIVLYAFSLVFRYGTILQKESDETL